MIAVKNAIPVKDAAKELGVTPSRIRQLCGQHNIGEMLTPMFRVLTVADVRRLRRILSEPKQGRSRKNWATTA